MLYHEKDNLIKRKEELKKELGEINKKLKNINSYEFQRKDENFIFCKCCNKKINKYSFSKHEKTEGHILRSKLNENENKNS